MDRLHYHPLSPYSRKAYVAGLLCRMDFERAIIRLGTGALSGPEFREISPFGKIPVLETSAGLIFESTSIAEYWEERRPGTLLTPDSARVARHFDRLGDLYLIDPVAALWWEPASPVALEAPGTVAKAWALIEHQLSDGRPFVGGTAFGLGDLGSAIATDYLERLGIAAPAPIAAWRERCFEIPEMKIAHSEAQPFIEAMLPKRITRAK